MDGQAVAGKPLGQHRHDLAGVRFQFAADDKIISKADQETSSLQAWLDLMLKPCIEDLMEKDIGQHGGNGSPLHDACFGMVQHPFFPDPGTEPFPNKAHYPPIIDSVAEYFPQSSPVNTVEISTDICIHDPTNTLRHAPLSQFLQCLMGATSWPKAIRAVVEVLLVD